VFGNNKLANIFICFVLLATIAIPRNDAIVKATPPPDPDNFRVPFVGDVELTRVGGRSGTGTFYYYGYDDPLTQEDERHLGTYGSYYMDINDRNAPHGNDAGTPVYASGDGHITDVDYQNEIGNYVVLETDAGVTFKYAHLARALVTDEVPYNEVEEGDLIGLLGNTGTNTTGPHLHWEAWETVDLDPYADIFYIPGVSANFSAPCGDNPDGTIRGPALPNNAYDNCTAYHAQNLTGVTLFDRKDCSGNPHPITTPGDYDLTYTWNDRTRSMYIQDGWSVLMRAHAPGQPIYEYCSKEDMWDLDSDNDVYTGTNIQIGYNSAHDVNGFNLISWVKVYHNDNCDGRWVAGVSHTSGGEGLLYTGTGTGGGSGDHVTLYENQNCTGTHYGWVDPTNGWANFDGSTGPDYMNNIASCALVQPGWSVLVTENFSGGGGIKCLTSNATSLGEGTYDTGNNMNENISAVNVFHNANCNGYAGDGVSTNDTVTIWDDPDYWDEHYGWHDPGASYYIPSNLVNLITSIGVTPGWSLAVYQDANQSGGFACFTASDKDLSNNYLSNGEAANDNIESVYVYHDTSCGGLNNPPTITLAQTATDPATHEIQATLNWSNAAAEWQILDWGDGTTVGNYGTSGTNVTETHQYDPGSYAVALTVRGNNGQWYTISQIVNVPVVDVSYPLSDATQGLVEATTSWENAIEDWQILDWGDQTDVGYNGSSGYLTDSHVYAPGNYTMTFTVKGSGGGEYTQSVLVKVTTLSLDYSVDQQNQRLYQADIEWSNATATWHILDWGDNTNVGYYGTSGSYSPTHVYNPGTYTMTLTVIGADGLEYTDTETFTVN
jgi:hypothetical protein